MKKRQFMFLLGIILVFILGGICGIYFASTSSTLKIIEETDIRNNCIDLRRSVFYLNLLKKNDLETLRESFEWDIDEALLALNQYMDGGKKISRFDEYCLTSLAMISNYRKENPRHTKHTVTDQIVYIVLSNPSVLERSSNINLQ